MILLRLDRYEEAAEAYGRAIEVGPPDVELDKLKQQAQERSQKYRPRNELGIPN